jgi:energy-coupling factor transport system permease protein
MGIEKLDPRTKLVLALCLAGAVIGAGGYAGLTGALAVLLAAVISMRLLEAYTRWLRLVLPMSLFFGAVVWWTAGLQEAGYAALKLLTLTSVFFLFFSITDPEDLANSLVKAGLPFPVAFVLSASLQFVPVMGRKAAAVIDAQRARGIPIEGWAGLRWAPAFLSPMLIQAFQLAEELAEAMEARGFGLEGRTFLKEYRMRFRDWLAIGIGLAVTVIWIWM